MRTFIPEDAIFEVSSPTDWKYRKSTKGIHQFYNPSGIGNFYLSLSRDEKNEKFSQIRNNPKTKVEHFGKIKVFGYDFENDLKLNSKFWLFKQGKELFLATYTYYAEKEDTTQYFDDLYSIKKIISSIELIDERNREQRFAWYRLRNFLQNFAASEELFERASENGSFIESVTILAHQVDALLRIAITLSNQIKYQTSTIKTKFIYQGSNDRPIFERQIYKIAIEKEIIDESIFKELDRLYNQRNRVIHRYIISDITTRDILDIAIKYLNVKRKIVEVVDELEQEQMELSIGMTTEHLDVEEKKIQEYHDLFQKEIIEKHGGIDFENLP